MAYQKYQKQVFTDFDETDPLTAAKMRHIEAGIVALEENMAKAEDIPTAANDAVAGHNTSEKAHADLRLELKALSERLNAFFDSDDTTLDELSEIIAYIQSNKSLIDAITTSKVSVTDIVDDLVTNAANKPLSAAQGVALKSLVDALSADKLDASELTEAINTALAQASITGKEVATVDITFTGTTLTYGSGVTLEAGKVYALDYSMNALYAFCMVGGEVVLRMGGSGSKAGRATAIPANTGELVIYTYADNFAEGDVAHICITEPVSPSVAKAFDYTSYPLPVLALTGNAGAMTKTSEVTLGYTYKGMSGTANVKWQGGSSLAYEKKNYTIKFDQAFEAASGWGEQKKYCLKANYIDFTHARNIVAAKLWGQIVKGLGSATNFYSLPNAGAVDGFPIVVTINGEYQGLYAITIPKDKWLFGMSGDVATEAIVSAEGECAATKFNAPAVLDGSDFEFEHIADSADRESMIASFNNIYTALSTCASQNDLINNVGEYVDIPIATLYYVFVTMLQAMDDVFKNVLFVTLDGVKWQPSAYDLDTTFGGNFRGDGYYYPSYDMFANMASRSALFNKIYTYYPAYLIDQYKVLRRYTLSEINVFDKFYNYLAGIPKVYYDEEVKVWKSLPGTNTSNMSQIMEHYRIRCARLDEEIAALEASLAAT